MPASKEEKTVPKFQKGDDVLGVIDGLPARGKVASVNEKKGTIRITRRGPAAMHNSKQMIKGQFEQHDVPAGNFELIYRKGA